LNAEKRLSNELACTIGWAPATSPSLAAGADAGVSESAGFNGGRATACLISGFGGSGLDTASFDASGLEAFAIAASGRAGGSFRLASTIRGFAAGTGLAVAVVSAGALKPTLRARLLKKPSDCEVGVADATRVAGSGG
jgi:hypothetical protein